MKIKDSFDCECGMCGCNKFFESDKFWDEGDKVRTSEDQILLHPNCEYQKYFTVVHVGNHFLLAEDV